MSKFASTFCTSSRSSICSSSLRSESAAAPSTFTVFFGTQASSASVATSPALSSACFTRCRSDGAVVITNWPSSFTKSSAPASRTFSMTASSSRPLAGT